MYCQVWSDSRLAWNASEFGNVVIIVVTDDDIWVPDIVLMNR